MKKFILSIGILIAVFYSYSQTGTYMVTLKWEICSPTSNYSAIITDPTGNTTVQVLPDANNDAVNYNTQLNIILSNITTLGYHLTSQMVHPGGINTAGCSNNFSLYLFSPCCAP